MQSSVSALSKETTRRHRAGSKTAKIPTRKSDEPPSRPSQNWTELKSSWVSGHSLLTVEKWKIAKTKFSFFV